MTPVLYVRVILCLCLTGFLPFIKAQATTIVTLSPHLTEWVYSLGQQEQLLAVSAHSDYPLQAAKLPVVADYNGVDIKAIVRLNPDLILAWDGGNKPQDIARLKALGFNVFLSSPRKPADISREIRRLGTQLGVSDAAEAVTRPFDEGLEGLQEQYQQRPFTKVFYYMWAQPLMTIGSAAWANSLLSVCGADTVFSDSPVVYPQVSIQEVIRRQPSFIIAASGRPLSAEKAFWDSHRSVLDTPLIQVNPDITSRFTLRLLPELTRICEALHPA
ncbi:cobalamin-binding protein [Salinimonas sediminis]|uniref:Cobalamin-binding protein n=1 Tax=Salinimonas sediminis TaxID=2303538 RepID=A0A346NPV8_9ALTE|nr:cobalamin-binding protein [Salinimonas sediminis]